MITREDRLKYYSDMFGHIEDDKKRETAIRKALDTALDIRKFEITLYWERAKYFWVFIAASFAGYFWALQQKEPNQQIDNIIFVLNCFGIVATYAWFLVIRGSKYWQENWELHVDYLEDELQGILYKYVKTNRNVVSSGLLNSYSFSVSKINLYLCIFLVSFWLILLAWFFTEKCFMGITPGSWVIRLGSLLLAITFVCSASYVCRTKDAKKKMGITDSDFVSRNEYRDNTKDEV